MVVQAESGIQDASLEPVITSLEVSAISPDPASQSSQSPVMPSNAVTIETLEVTHNDSMIEQCKKLFHVMGTEYWRLRSGTHAQCFFSFKLFTSIEHNSFPCVAV